MSEVTTQPEHPNNPTQAVEPPSSGVGPQLIFAGFAGPIPPPEVLEYYKKVDPRIVDHILEFSRNAQEQVSKESERRHHLNCEQISTGHKIATTSLVFGFFTVMSLIGLAAYVAYLGHPWQASIVGGATIALTIGAFRKFTRP